MALGGRSSNMKQRLPHVPLKAKANAAEGKKSLWLALSALYDCF